MKSITDIEAQTEYVSGLATSEVRVMNTDYIYLLTMSNGDTYELVGVFHEPEDAIAAKQVLVLRGINPSIIDIDHAPIGVIDLRGVDSPYIEGPIH